MREDSGSVRRAEERPAGGGDRAARDVIELREVGLPLCARRAAGAHSRGMSTLEIGEATAGERLWAGRLMASSEPSTRSAAARRSRAAPRPGTSRSWPGRRGARGVGRFIRAASPKRPRSNAAARGGRAASGRSLAAGEAAPRRPHQRVSYFNVRARSLYERLGYRAVGSLSDYVVDGFSEILMVKRLP